jgi:hypothetical protein
MLVSTFSSQQQHAPESGFATMNLVAGGCCTMSKDRDARGRTVLRPATRDNLSVADIDGAQPYDPILRLTNKPDLYKPNDIAGSSSMRLHKDTNRVDRRLQHEDIEGSKPKRSVFLHAGRQVNPLGKGTAVFVLYAFARSEQLFDTDQGLLMIDCMCTDPDYKLPANTWTAPPEPRFLRDSYNVDDIAGTRSQPLYKYKQRETFSCDDIEGAKAGWKPRHVRARLDAPARDYTLNVHDITDSGFKTSRCTNPLMPVYTVYGMVHEDHPVLSKPRALPKQLNTPYYTLTTADIEGAQPGWKPPTLMQVYAF